MFQVSHILRNHFVLHHQFLLLQYYFLISQLKEKENIILPHLAFLLPTVFLLPFIASPLERALCRFLVCISILL